MSEKRKDSKGRILRNGEYQRSDGKYEYRYVDLDGERKSAYSWTLVDSDKLPSGKKRDRSLRAIEVEIKQNLSDGIRAVDAKKLTVDEAVSSYLNMKDEIKPTSRLNYERIYRIYIKDSIGSRSVGSIRYSDIMKLYKSMIEKNISISTIENVQTVLHPVFEIAVRDGYIRYNPTNGVLTELKKKTGYTRTKRHALTEEEQKNFLKYVKNSPEYKGWIPLLTAFFGTGCRIGELLGLRWDDCDFKNEIISINHNLAYYPTDGGKAEPHILTTKTGAGNREIPMLAEVKMMLLDELERQKREGANTSVIDGYTNFVFTNSRGTVYNRTYVDTKLRVMRKSYNEFERMSAIMEDRDPVFLPHFSAHTFRHTFCCRLCEHERNLKIIQEIMGHANINVTMDVYNEVTTAQKKSSFAAIEDKLSLF